MKKLKIFAFNFLMLLIAIIIVRMLYESKPNLVTGKLRAVFIIFDWILILSMSWFIYFAVSHFLKAYTR